jgi:hypothetical protein
MYFQPYTHTQILIGCSLLLYIAIFVLRSLKHRLALKPFPGPQWANVTCQWLVRTYASGNSREIFDEMSRKYGASFTNTLIEKAFILLLHRRESRQNWTEPSLDK